MKNAVTAKEGPARKKSSGVSKPSIASNTASPRRKEKSIRSADKMSIANKKQYAAAMVRVDELTRIPDGTLSKSEAAELRAIAKAVEAYEASIYTVSAPTSLEGLLELKMYELRLKQFQLAKMLNLREARFSLLLSGKVKPDLKTIIALHKQFGVDGNLLLELADVK